MLDYKKVRFAKAKLKESARLWQYSMRDKLFRIGQPPVNSWEEMKMKENFLPTKS